MSLLALSSLCLTRFLSDLHARWRTADGLRLLRSSLSLVASEAAPHSAVLPSSAGQCSEVASINGAGGGFVGHAFTVAKHVFLSNIMIRC